MYSSIYPSIDPCNVLLVYLLIILLAVFLLLLLLTIDRTHPLLPHPPRGRFPKRLTQGARWVGKTQANSPTLQA